MEIKDINIKVADALFRKYGSTKYDTWLRPIESANLNKNNIRIIAESDFNKEIINTRYLKEIEILYKYFINEKIIVEIQVKESKQHDIDILKFIK